MRCVEYDAYSFDVTEVSNFGEIQDVTFIKPVDSIKGDQGSIKFLAQYAWVFQSVHVFEDVFCHIESCRFKHFLGAAFCFGAVTATSPTNQSFVVLIQDGLSCEVRDHQRRSIQSYLVAKNIFFPK